MVAAPLYFTISLCIRAVNPSPLISAMATAKKTRKVDSEGRRFQERWELQYFFTENQGNCVCLICKEAVALFKDFNVKRHYQTKHANTYDKLTGSDRAEKVKQLQAALASQQRFFTRRRVAASSSTHQRKLLATQALPSSKLRLDVQQENLNQPLSCTTQQKPTRRFHTTSNGTATTPSSTFQGR